MKKIGKQIIAFIICISMLFQMQFTYTADAETAILDEEAIMDEVADSWLETCKWINKESMNALNFIDPVIDDLDFSSTQEMVNSAGEIIESYEFSLAIDQVKEILKEENAKEILEKVQKEGFSSLVDAELKTLTNSVKKDFLDDPDNSLAEYIKSNYKFIIAANFANVASIFFEKALNETGDEKGVSLAMGVWHATIACDFAARDCDKITKDRDLTAADLLDKSFEMTPVLGDAYENLKFKISVGEVVVNLCSDNAVYSGLFPYMKGSKSYKDNFIEYYSSIINQYGDYKVAVNADGSLTLVGYPGYGKTIEQYEDLVIPDYYQGGDVSKIDTWFAYENAEITSVTIQGDSLQFGYQAFYKCPKLSEVNYNATHATHTDYAICDTSGIFYDCGKNEKENIIINLNIGKGVQTIPPALFMYCRLADVIIPEGVTSIGELAFYECTNIGKVVIPQSVERISRRVISGCDSLKEVQYNARNAIHTDNMIHDYSGIFYDCGGNFNLVIGDEVEGIPPALCMECSGITSVVIPEGVTSIGTMAFYLCKNITEVEIPQSVKWLSRYTFRRCTNLKEVRYNAKNAWHTDTIICDTSGVFDECKGNINLIIGENVETIPPALIMYSSVTSLKIPASVTYIGKWPFMGCPVETVTGYSGTLAEEYARVCGHEFISLGNLVTTEPEPSTQPSQESSPEQSARPSQEPSIEPSQVPSSKPSVQPSKIPSEVSSLQPSEVVTEEPNEEPSEVVSEEPDEKFNENQSMPPSNVPSTRPSEAPDLIPSEMSSGTPDMQLSPTPDILKKDITFYDVDIDKNITLSDAQSILKSALKITPSKISYTLADAQKALKVALKIETL